MTELLVGTKKGLFVLEGTPGEGFEVTARAFAGEPVEYAMRDPGSGRILAAVTSAFYGPKLHYADDAGGEWTQASGVALPEGGDAGARAAVGDRARRGRAGCTWAAIRACCSSRPTAARAGRSCARCGTTRRARTGSPAAAGCACTRSCRGRASRRSSRSRCPPSASG